MRSLFVCSFLVVLCLMNTLAQSPLDLAEIWEKNHISNKFPSDVRHKDLLGYLDQLKKLGVKVEEVGRSNGGREIFQIEFGGGPKRVFMWSQMHGDEPTATSAVIDMFAWMQQNRETPLVKKIESEMTIRVVPMLNPDGAELYQRRNLQSIDINRDAVALQTPEGRLLKKLRDDWSPEIGFNLHNQNALTTVGRTGKQAAISLLVVYGDAAKTRTPGLDRNRRVASAMTIALHQFIPGYIGRYDDGWSPTAFGDNFSAWGTPVILVETGALHGKDEMFLVKMNFIALMTALRSLADGSEAAQSTAPYDSLVENGSGNLYNFLFHDANLVTAVNGRKIYKADVAMNAERRRASITAPVYIREIGDIRRGVGLEEYDASGFNVVQRQGTLSVGALGDLLFYKTSRTVDWAAADLEKRFEPDAVFSAGKWVKGEGVVPRK